MSHFILLFCVLFGGFLAWGLALDYQAWLKTHVFGKVPFQAKLKEWLKSLVPPQKHPFDLIYEQNILRAFDNQTFAMNTQQQFIRPTASPIPEVFRNVEWGNFPAMEARRKLEKDWDMAIWENWFEDRRYLLTDTPEEYLKRIGKLKP